MKITTFRGIWAVVLVSATVSVGCANKGNIRSCDQIDLNNEEVLINNVSAGKWGISSQWVKQEIFDNLRRHGAIIKAPSGGPTPATVSNDASKKGPYRIDLTIQKASDGQYLAAADVVNLKSGNLAGVGTGGENEDIKEAKERARVALQSIMAGTCQHDVSH